MWRQETRDRRPRLEGFGRGCYALHLWCVGAIAASNILLGLAGLAALASRDGKTGFWRRHSLLLQPFAWFVALFCLSIGYSYLPAVSLPDLDDLYSLLPLLLTLFFLRGERDARRVVNGLVIMGAALAAMGLIQLGVGAAGLDLERRLIGPFSHYQTFAGVLLLCDMLILGRVLTRGVSRSPWSTAAAVMLTAALLANLTRGPWVALVVTGLGLLAFTSPRRLLLVLPGLVVVGLLLPTAVLDRAKSIVDLQDESNYDRLCMLEAGIRMISERPLFGLGPSVVEERYSLYRHPTAVNDRRPHLHSAYLQLAAERGLPSAVLFVAILALSLTQSLRNYRRDGGASGSRADLHLGAAAAIVAYTLAALFEDSWTDTEVQRVALFVIALPFSLKRPADIA